ncbi:ATP-binding cassette domain-containing protein [Kaistella sp.]|uniref:ATP-binding cassette domain-containing protein n=1 Tax=Kaistella sp. TaxID=2782235 RepID=UPI003C327221
MEILKLHVDSIEKSFGEQKILKDIFIGCETNEIVGVLGRNGSGKTTLFNIIFGTASAENKFIRVGSKVITKVSDNKNLIHFLAQNHFLPSHLKIKNSIDLFCNESNAYNLKNHQLMSSYLDKKPHHLSGGEKRLLEILILLFSDCRFLLLDEPFHSLSPKIIEEIKLLITEQSKDKGIIITDHQYQHVLEISDKIFLLKEGSTKILNGTDDLKKLGYLR